MADDMIPSLIGPKSNAYQLDRTQLLGDGHSGQVYAGWKVNNKALQVAIKLDKTSGAKHEWAMLKKMQGKGVPKVHYTGTTRCLLSCPAPRASPRSMHTMRARIWGARSAVGACGVALWREPALCACLVFRHVGFCLGVSPALASLTSIEPLMPIG